MYSFGKKKFEEFWDGLVMCIFSFTVPTTCTYNMCDITASSLRHVSAWQCHLQGVQNKLKIVYGKRKIHLLYQYKTWFFTLYFLHRTL